MLGLFVGTSLVPRAGLYHHHHAGGEHEHVHPWGTDVVHDDDDDHDHARYPIDGVSLDDGDHASSEHFHSQAPFQTAAAARAPRVVRIVAAAILPALTSRCPGFRPPIATSARAPPPIASS